MRRGHDLPLSSYGLVGDRHTAALVADDGAVDWLCLDRFDGPPVFCRLLDHQRGGYVQIAPAAAFTSRQRYLGDTNVLATEFTCASGELRVTDCMPLGDGDSMLLRRIEAIGGTVAVRVDFAPTFDFARATTTLEATADGCIARAEGRQLGLFGVPQPTVHGSVATGSLTLAPGRPHWITIARDAPRAGDDHAAMLRATLDAWECWSRSGRRRGRYDRWLTRSALVLELLIHAPTGAIVAAPTTSVPEAPGAGRNWDYRFAWLRDSSWVVDALMELGHHDEAMAFIAWLESLDLGTSGPSVLYDLDGRTPAAEIELHHLQGYRGSRPVRVGNAAMGQDQHDVFGEVIAAIRMCSDAMPSMRPLPPKLWGIVASLADRAAAHWMHPDQGMWEARDRGRRYVSSLALSWVALDAAGAIARRDGLGADRWAETRGRIRTTLLTEGFDPALGSFRRALDGAELDAAALLLPRHGLLDANDPRMLATVASIRRQLARGDLVRRYVGRDGLPAREGAFVACSFWLADCLARQHRVDEAREVFEHVTSLARGVGLFSEEIDPATGEFLGNYPQAFTHLALIRAGVSIERAEEALGRS